MAGRKKGTPKTGGRKKGTKNKKTIEGEKFFKDIFFSDPEAIKKSFEKLGDKEKLDIIAKFAPFVFPRMSTTESKVSLSVNDMTPDQIEEQFKRLEEFNSYNEEEE